MTPVCQLLWPKVVEEAREALRESYGEGVKTELAPKLNELWRVLKREAEARDLPLGALVVFVDAVAELLVRDALEHTDCDAHNGAAVH